ncbi:MAG: NADH-quinone oxidoreductase subunit I [Oscillospiraceae bacterium]
MDQKHVEKKTLDNKEYRPHKSTRYINVRMGSNGLPMMKNAQGEWIDTSKKLPELYESREDCCGCSACFAVCPMQAIAMENDEEGFEYPTIDAEKCIRCYKCLSVCVFKANKE